MEAHKPTTETISSSRGSNCPPKCQWIGSSSEEMELCAQMGAHTAPPPAENDSKMVRVCVCVCVCVCRPLDALAFVTVCI